MTAQEPIEAEALPKDLPTGSTVEADAWAGLDLDAIEPSITIDHETGETLESPPIGDFLTHEQFYEGVFKAGFHAIPAALLKLDSLPIKANEEESARAASDAIYDTCMEMPWLHFLIKPENIYMQRAMVVLAYAIPKAGAVKAELAARHTQQEEQASE